MKIVFTISDASHAMRTGGEIEARSYIIDLPAEMIPAAIARHLEERSLETDDRPLFKSMSVSIAE